MNERTVVPLPEPVDSDAGPAFLQVVRGVPTTEELVALVTVLLAEQDGPAASSGPSRSYWSDPARLLRGSATRGPLDRGPGAWRRSAGPL
ncbi:MAG: acyl-CoA carboxylase subunit epsilon [Streptosporangiaceae bacterium]|nr:acyl-CoA carboxylase subunit epsilon [Streptosporangiaceae bacterium]